MAKAQAKEIKRSVVLEGIKPILFDRYPGENGITLETKKKFYFDADGNIVLPITNILSFLCSEQSECATRRTFGRKWKSIAKAAISYIDISPELIPFKQNENLITVDTADMTIVSHVARVKGGIPNPKERPQLNVPWELHFTLTLFANDEISEETLKTIFEQGGRSLGLGTYRGLYGKFKVKTWE